MTEHSEATKSKSLIRTILKKDPDKNVIENLGKLLTGYPDLKVPLQDLVFATARLKLDLRKNFGSELEKFYRKFLEKCLEERILRVEDWKALQQLKVLFGFTDAAVERIHNQVVMKRYRKTVEQAMVDKKLDFRQRSSLKSMEQNLKLPAAIVEQIYRDKASELIQRRLIGALSDGRLSPAEEEELDSIAHHLGVRLEYDEKTRNLLDRYRLFWLIENGEIPSVDVPALLTRKEKCYFTADANWCELKSVTRSARFGKTEAGEEPEQIRRQTYQELSPVDTGKMYLTNKRILFLGSRRLRSIPLTRIKDFIPTENGVHVHRKSGTHPFLQFDLAVDVFSLILSRVLRDLH